MLLRILKDIFKSKNLEAQPINIRNTKPFLRDSKIPSVLILTHTYHGNGAAEMLFFLMQWLVSDFNWQLTVLSRGLSETDYKILQEIGVKLVESIDPEQYDFAITNTLVSGLSYVDEFHEIIPCLLWVHEGEIMIWNSTASVGQWKRIFSQTAHVVFQSNWQAERIFGSFTSSLSPNRYSVIPNCLLSIAEKKIIDYPYESNTKKRVIFIGSLYDRKRPTDLIEAINLLDINDIECIFIGTTDYLDTFPDHIQKILNNDSRFLIVGEIPRSEAIEYLRSATVLSLPSSDESQPLVLLEAAALNIPIVISDLAVYREYWIDGVNCLKHPVGDVAMLAKHLLTCLEGNAPPPKLAPEFDISQTTFQARFGKILNDLLPTPLKSNDFIATSTIKIKTET